MQIDRFVFKNRVNWSNFNGTILKFPEKFDNLFLHVFIFRNKFPESHCFVAMPVTSRSIHVLIYQYLSSEERRNCSILWPVQHRNRYSHETCMLRNIKTCENWRSNFSENLRIVQFKVVEITRFLSPKSINLQLFTLILYGVGGPLWCWHL